MIYQVRVLNPQGQTQQIINPEQLTQNYWNNFWEQENNMGFKAANNAKFFKKVKRTKN
ncbi:MAG: hypothetical protein H8E32_10555 [Nitrospinae bacterium]|nr:hypothetical protein [Nitrospinota bacterium]